MNPKTHLRLFCVLLAACLLLPLAAACRQGGEGIGTQTGTHTDSPGTESGTFGSGETIGKPDDPIAPNDTGFSVSRLRVDSQTLPLGLDNAAPLFSWNMTVGQEDTVRGRVQTAYRVLVASDRGLLGVRHGGYVGQRNGAGRCLRQHPLRGSAASADDTLLLDCAGHGRKRRDAVCAGRVV